MKRKARLVASVALGLVAAALAMFYASSVRAEATAEQSEMLERYGGELVKVCVASCDIDAGETVDESNSHIEEWVATLLPGDAIKSMRDVAGKKATSRIPANAVMSETYFEKSGQSISVPKGTVAISIASDEQHALGGTLRQGDSVDVYVSKDGVADRLCAARVIETSAGVEAVGQASITWVMLAVEPDKVQEMLAASARGEISLTMPGASVETASEEAE